MNSLVLNTIKTDSIKAGYRIASTQLTNVVRNSVINILRNQDIAESQLSAVHSFLSSEAGSSFVQYLLGLSLQYAPKIKDNVHVARVSRELRVEGITGAGSFLTSTLFSSLMPILSSIPEMRIEELEEEQTSEVDILAAETEAIAQATGG